MDQTNSPVCLKCGTPLVPAKKHIAYDDSLPRDGSANFNNQVCPKFHPELVETNTQFHQFLVTHHTSEPQDYIYLENVILLTPMSFT